VVAIGGITLANAEAVLRAGADAVAVIPAVARADNPEAIVRQLVRIYCDVKRGA
ncbi:MAG TPA: thiamine phosphate synthase, partial [Armatimonadetes bacterium]|nr:thiamine phosphate synthase [Armatimonadota bacterium]